MAEGLTAEAVALELMKTIATLEKKELVIVGGKEMADRKWIIDTYAECLDAIKNPALRVLDMKRSQTRT